MLNMENAEEVMQILERFTRLKQKEIPKELDDYMHYVAKTGDTVFKWSSLKYLFREKLLNVIKNFHDTSPRVDDLPQYPNVDPFNYESMKSSLLERLELFNAAPFTVQRLCELLTEPRKQYSRIDKFMRALEKNILVSTIEPGRKRTESENGDSLDSVVNGDVSLDVNVDIDMENETTIFNAEAQTNATSSSTPSSQPSSNLTHKSDDDILPNPKKPKLDLDETNDAETEAATKSITNNKPDSAEPSVEKVIAEETTDITDNKKNAERVAEEASASDEKPDAAAIKADSSKDNKVSESEKMEEDTPVASTVENNSVDKIKEVEPEKKTDEKEETTITSTSSEVEVAEASPSTTAPEATVAPVAVEAIDSTEKTEKVDDEPEGKKKDCAEEVIEKQDTSKEIESDKVIKEKTDDEQTPKGNKKEIEEKTETTITTTNSEKTNDKQESTPDETVAPSNEKKSEEVVKEKTKEVAVTPVAVAVVKESKDEVETTKTKAADPGEASKPLEAKPADEVAATAETVPVVPSEEIKETKIENATEPAKKVDAADQPPPVIESPQTESLETPTKILSTESKEKGTEKPAEVVPPTAAPPAESNDVAVPVVVDEPTVTTDQPMDENPESIAEAEPVVPSIVVEAAANVEEVVMGDSVEMATDAIEPAKDEPAGMEVDDTSQEAMDQ